MKAAMAASDVSPSAGSKVDNFSLRKRGDPDDRQRRHELNHRTVIVVHKLLKAKLLLSVKGTPSCKRSHKSVGEGSGACKHRGLRLAWLVAHLGILARSGGYAIGGPQGVWRMGQLRCQYGSAWHKNGTVPAKNCATECLTT